MSVKLMSAIFETEFFDLKDAEGNITKGSTAKLVLLALADHANDEGEGAYPSVEKLSRKTALVPQTIRNAIDALRHNGVIFFVGTSKRNTNNHTINVNSFPKLWGEKDGVLTLQPIDPLTDNKNPSNQLLKPLQPLEANHTLTVQETSSRPSKKSQFRSAEWDVMHGIQPTEEGVETARRIETYTDVANRLSAGLRRGEFPQTIEAQKVYRWIAEREAEGQSLGGFISWAMDGKRAEYSFVYHKDPSLIKRDWLQVYSETKTIVQPDKDKGYF